MDAAEKQACETYGRDLAVVPDVHPDDFIYQFLITNPTFPNKDQAVKYYFNDGRASADKLRHLVEQDLGMAGKTISLLEFASGYGAVTRHLPNTLPNARIVACDIHPAAMEFLKTRLRAEVLLSNSVPEKFMPPQKFDVVFALSFFSHMPRSTWGRWLKQLYSVVAPDGYLIFTTQGPTSKQFFPDAVLTDEGYWFKAESEQKDLDTDEYGQTIVTAEFVVREASKYIDRQPMLIRPAFWWTHQDMYVFKK